MPMWPAVSSESKKGEGAIKRWVVIGLVGSVWGDLHLTLPESDLSIPETGALISCFERVAIAVCPGPLSITGQRPIMQ